MGEILYNLRSALDHLIYALGNPPPDRSEFPIFKDEALFFEKEKNGKPTRRSGLFKISGVTKPETRAEIERLQPFRVRGDKTESYAWLLNELCNIDKHRTLHLCRRQPEIGLMRFVRDITFTKNMTHNIVIGPLEERTVLAVWTPVVLDNEVDMEGNLSLYIAFNESQVPLVTGKAVDAVCEGLLSCVKRMVERVVATV